MDGTGKKLIYQYTLPSLKGNLAANEEIDINIPWYQTDNNGKVPPGYYFPTLEIPKQIQFLNEGTGKKENWDVFLQNGGTDWLTLK
jgi:hypothetical protein